MKKIDSRGGQPVALGKVLNDAVRSGKQIGAPALNKALKHLNPEKLTRHDVKQLRDAFEHGRLTPKARALAEKLLGYGSGIHKFKADEPVRPSLPGVKPPVMKVHADVPVGPKPPISTKPPVLKVHADVPISPQPPITTKPPVMKVRADQPVSPLPLPSIKPPIVKVKADEPL